MDNSNQTQSPNIAGFLPHNGKVLIVKRSKHEEMYSGFYELPGGGIDFKESPAKALKREFKEETNLDVEIENPIRVFDYMSDDQKIHYVEIIFMTRLIGSAKEIKLSKEHDDYKWIALDEIDDYKISPEIKKNIRAGFKQLLK